MVVNLFMRAQRQQRLWSNVPASQEENYDILFQQHELLNFIWKALQTKGTPELRSEMCYFITTIVAVLIQTMCSNILSPLRQILQLQRWVGLGGRMAVQSNRQQDLPQHCWTALQGFWHSVYAHRLHLGCEGLGSGGQWRQVTHEQIALTASFSTFLFSPN